MPAFIRILPLILLPIVLNCAPSKQQAIIHQLPNYDPKAVHRIVFVDFTIRRNTSRPTEQINLTNSIIGNGELKPIGQPVHTPYQLQIRYYSNDKQVIKTDSLEHPLFRSLEIANTNGTFDRSLRTEQEGHFSIRFPYTDSLTKLEIYSQTPDRPVRKIYTLSLKP